MKAYKAAAVQMNSQPDINHNIEQAYGFVKDASRKGAVLIGLPENFAFLGDLSARIDQADRISSAAEIFLKETAREFEIYLYGGGYPVPAGKGKVFNRFMLFGPGGETVAQYDKIHLFDVDLERGETYRESEYVQPGKIKAVVYKSDEIGNIGLSICYDLRFPELYRRLSADQAEVLCIPSAFTRTTGEAHWEPLIRARAIENTCYVMAPAQTGTHGKHRKTNGHAMIVDPWGRVVADAGTEPGIAFAEVEPEKIGAARSAIPSLKHRRL